LFFRSKTQEDLLLHKEWRKEGDHLKQCREERFSCSIAEKEKKQDSSPNTDGRLSVKVHYAGRRKTPRKRGFYMIVAVAKKPLLRHRSRKGEDQDPDLKRAHGNG